MDPTVQRHHLAQHHRAMIAKIYRDERVLGLVNPLVWVLDLKDSRGREIAVQVEAKHLRASREVVDTIFARDGGAIEREGNHCCLVVVLSCEISLTLAGQLSESGPRGVWALIRARGEGKIPAVVVSGEGTAYLAFPPTN